MVLVYRDADLNQFPQVKKQESKHLSLGDLHGNALKLIYILVEEGVLELDETRYKLLRDIYTTEVNQLTAEQLSSFQEIIEHAQVNPEKAITLIGDELADRGNNDYFTLLVLKKLHDSKVNLNILLSNHSAEFIRDYDNPQFTGFYNLSPGQGQSLAGMQFLIGKGLIKEDDVRGIVKDCYIPKVKAISYTFSPEGDITLFSHAPIGLETIQALAKKFNLPYNDKTPKQLIHTIDGINKVIETLFTNKQLSALIDGEGYHADPSSPVPPGSKPLQRLIWNRVVGDELITETSSGIKVNFVHGHIGDGEILKNGQSLPSHQNLDNSWGKFPPVYTTGYSSYLEVDVKHFTRHSNDLTSLEITDSLWQAMSTKIAKKQFDALVIDLKEKTDLLISKGTKTNPQYNPKYEKAAEAAKKLQDAISESEKVFFTQPVGKKSIQHFANSIQDAVVEANKEFVNHRSLWHGNNPLITFIKGVLGVISFLLLGIPALAVSLGTKHGYAATFFTTPTTDATEKLNSFEQNFSELIKEIEQGVPLDDRERPEAPSDEPPSLTN